MARARCGEGCTDRWTRLKRPILDGWKEGCGLCLIHRTAAATMSLKRDYTSSRNTGRSSSVPCKIVGCNCCCYRSLETVDQPGDKAEFMVASPFSAAFLADLGLPSSFRLVRPTVFLNQL